MHPVRQAMSTPWGLRQAVLRAVSEDNRSLIAARPDSRPHTGSRRRRQLTGASGRLSLPTRFGAGLLVVGAFVLSPALTDLSAGWVETLPAAQQPRDEGAFDRVSAGRWDLASDTGGGPFTPFDGIVARNAFQASLPFADDAPADGLDYTPASPHGYGSSAAVEALPIATLFGLNVRTIVVDAGHGGADPGAVGALGTREKDVTLEVARRLASRLERGGRYRVVLTRSGDETVSLARRVDLANAANADLFVSIHVNALPNRHVNVIETYYFDFSEDPAALQLAAIENRDSEMPVGYFRTLVDKIADTVKLQESRALAQHIQTSMVNNVRAHDAKVYDSGVKVAPFMVLMGVGVPAVLVEISCISNRNEEMKLRTPQYRDNVASFLDEGIASYLHHRQLQARGLGDHEREDASEIAHHHRQGS